MTSYCRRVPPSWCRRLQAGGLLLVGCLLAALALRTWVCQGLLLPVRVTEASMAPALLGDHWRVHCPQCGRKLDFDARQDTRLEKVICAGCRQPFDASRSATFLRGDRVLIDKWAATHGDPTRWDVWALRDPQRDDRLLVKRVVGLPGEQVSLLDGDVYINGRILKKSLSEFRRLAILVAEEQFDDGRPGDSMSCTPWRTQSAPSHWQLRDTGWVFEKSSSSDSLVQDGDWLCYCPAGDSETPAIRDDYSYNQSVSRRLHDVHDLLLECDLTITASAILWFRAETPVGTWVVTWTVDPPSMQLLGDGHLIARQVPPKHRDGSSCRAEFGYWDRQLQFGVDGQSWFVFDGPSKAEGDGAHAGATWLSIGASDGELVIRRLRITRDVYYERPRGPFAGPLPVTLAADEYFLLGDNSPCSIDSRHRAIGPVARGRLVGQVGRW